MDESVDALARGLKSPEETRTHAQLRSDVLTDLILDSATLTSDPEQAGSGAITSHAPNAQRTTPDASTDQFAHDQRAGDAHEGPGCVQADDAQASDAPANDARGRDATGSTRSSVRVVGRGVRPTVIVTVPVMTLLGHTDEPGDLAGYGPIDAETARELARHAPSFIRLLTHPETGATLSVGRKRYRPPADLRTALQIEDESCRFPGCAAAAHRCELDHTHDWAAGGQTAAANLAHLCPKHHHLKHETRWKVRTGQDRTLHWTSPHGHDYTTTPARDTEPVASSGSQLTSVVREVHGERGGADTRPSSAAAGPEARTDAPF
ncbi:HNH endonuclease [Subtercola sp. PAMC28395]|nr:HNH endonuclease [Subtercola sp. PAMC28395]